MDRLAEQMRIESAIEMFQQRLERQRKPGKKRSQAIFTETMLDYLSNVLQAKAEGRPLAMISIVFPPEILLSMGVAVFAFEQYTIQMLSSGVGYEFMDRGEGYGFSKEACSPHKACVGLAVDGVFPEPDLLLYTGQLPCDSSAMMAEVIGNIYNCPTHWLNVPYKEDEEAVKHLTQGLREVIRFVEEQTGLTYDPEKLREYLVNGIVIQDYFLKTQELRRHVPSVLGAKHNFANFGIRMCSEGLPSVIEFMKAQYAECKELADQGLGVIPEEKHRLLLCGVYPFWNMGILDWMEKEFGAVAVVDFFSALMMGNLDEISKDPLESYARKILKIYPRLATLGGVSLELAHGFGKMASEFQCDSSLFFAHFGCKQTCGFNRVMTDTILEMSGIPSAIVDMDACDPSIMSEEQIKNQIRQYFHVLEARQASSFSGRGAKP